jgi:hypothetical protein
MRRHDAFELALVLLIHLEELDAKLKPFAPAYGCQSYFERGAEPSQKELELQRLSFSDGERALNEAPWHRDIENASLADVLAGGDEDATRDVNTFAIPSLNTDSFLL